MAMQKVEAVFNRLELGSFIQNRKLVASIKVAAMGRDRTGSMDAQAILSAANNLRGDTIGDRSRR